MVVRKDYLAVIVVEPKDPAEEVRVDAKCVVCGYVLPWKILRGKRALLACLWAVLVLFAQVPTVSPHGGGLDNFGCHRDRQRGEYHCHRGMFAGQSFNSRAEMLSRPHSGKPSETHARQPKAQYRMVRRVVDGDTLVLENGERVRLIGVDTPETKHPKKPVEYFGKEASRFTRKMVEGKRVRLEFDQANAYTGHKDKYRRTLAYVFLEDGTFLNAEIIKQGYGHA